MASLEEITANLAEGLAGELDTLTRETMSIGAHSFPEWALQPPVEGRLFELTRAILGAEVGSLRDGAELPAQLPAADAEGARELARATVAISTLVEAYRSGHQALWNRWCELVDAADLPPHARPRVRRAGSDFLFAYAGRVSSLAIAEYNDERARMLRTSDRSIAEAVTGVLDGNAGAAKRLDYPVDGHHVAIVGSGDRLATWLGRISRELDCQTLWLDVLPDPRWAWLGRSRPFDGDPVALLLRSALPDGCVVGIGSLRSGEPGFRASHRQAMASFRVAGPVRPIVDYSEIAMEELASLDRDAAREFVAAELAGIDGEDQRSRRLRETLITYFGCGDNARLTAARLGVHHQTVAQRLEAAAERLGVEIPGRRAELELALRLRDYPLER